MYADLQWNMSFCGADPAGETFSSEFSGKPVFSRQGCTFLYGEGNRPKTQASIF